MYKKIMSKITKNQILISVAVLAIIATTILVSNKSAPNNILSLLKFSSGLSDHAIAKRSLDYLNKSVLQNGQTAILDGISEEGGIIKMKIKIGDKNYDSYATKDGKLLFPEAFDMDGKPLAQPNQNAQAPVQSQQPQSPTPANVTKVAKSSLDVYVVSRCPFGLQIQRAIADAVKNIPSLSEYIKVRYIGSVSGSTITAMHGDAEAKENFRQIGIREEQKSKYWPYVACQMKSGDTEGCQKSAGVDIAKLNGCISDPNRCLAYAKEDFALGTKYNIQGSPTLVLNGKEVSETGFGGRSADSMRNIICSSSTTPPDFCKKTLDTNQAATSFSVSYGGSGN
jgi:hypothetical protein